MAPGLRPGLRRCLDRFYRLRRGGQPVGRRQARSPRAREGFAGPCSRRRKRACGLSRRVVSRVALGCFPSHPTRVELAAARRGGTMGPEVNVMTIDVDAVYEDGVLKPERPLGLKDKAKVHVTIEAKAEEVPTADDLAGWEAIDALRGIVKGAPPDTAEKHDKYLYGGPDE